jgi:hypothetical protein
MLSEMLIAVEEITNQYFVCTPHLSYVCYILSAI